MVLSLLQTVILPYSLTGFDRTFQAIIGIPHGSAGVMTRLHEEPNASFFACFVDGGNFMVLPPGLEPGTSPLSNIKAGLPTASGQSFPLRCRIYNFVVCRTSLVGDLSQSVIRNTKNY